MIFFDIDDTLIDSNLAHKEAIITLFELKNGPLNDRPKAEQEWSDITEHYLTKYFNKEIDLDEQRHRRLIDFWSLQRAKLSQREAIDFYPIYHQYFLNSCYVFSDVIASLEKIKHLPLGIISNGVVKDQLFKLEYNKILSYFSSFTISQEVGYAKPHTEIFNIAVQKAGEYASSCYYIGNSYTLDYMGAKQAGLRSIWLNRLDEDFTVAENEEFTSFSAAVESICSMT